MAVQRGLPGWGSRSSRGDDDARGYGCTVSGMGVAVATATAGAQDAQAMIKARASVVSVLPSGLAGLPMQPSPKGLAWSWAMVRGWSLQIMFSARVRQPRG
jgi:hypothetical protein